MKFCMRDLLGQKQSLDSWGQGEFHLKQESIVEPCYVDGKCLILLKTGNFVESPISYKGSDSTRNIPIAKLHEALETQQQFVPISELPPL